MTTPPAEPGPNSTTPLPPKTSERLLVEAWPKLVEGLEPKGVLCTSLGRAQLARAAAERHPQASVACVYLDEHHAELARSSPGEGAPANLSIECRADLVDATSDAEPGPEIAALPLTAQGDGELVREQLQQCYAALPIGGRLLASTDNERDTWLGEQLAALAGKAKRIDAADGAIYVATRREAPFRLRNFECRFAFRDSGRLFDVISRPGVFSHRRIDPGARRLIDAIEIADGDRVLDIGCGWGPVALAAAARGKNVAVEAIDSHARAVTCTRQNAAINGLGEQIVVRLEAAGRTDAAGSFDVAIGNPPYYADFRIAELFIRSAAAALRRGGRLWMVTKDAERYFDTLPREFREIEAEEVKGYVVVTGRRK